MWHYKTSVGTFIIRKEEYGSGWELRLLINPPYGLLGVSYKSYWSPKEAADAVKRQETGFAEWDDLEEVSPPRDVNSWGNGIPGAWSWCPSERGP